MINLSSYAQTQYDYYEGRNTYGGLNTAINGLAIIFIIILAILVLCVIAKIYVTIHDFFNDSQTNDNSNDNKSGNNSIQLTTQIKKKNEDNLKDEEQFNIQIDYHYEIITIEGNRIYGEYFLKDGTKSSDSFYYGISRIIHNLESDITDKIGLPVQKRCGSCYKGDHINYEDLEFETLLPEKNIIMLFIAGEFVPSKLQLMKIEEIDNLYSDFAIFYDGEAQKQVKLKVDEALEIKCVADVESVEGISAIGTVLEQVFLRLSQLLPLPYPDITQMATQNVSSFYSR